MVAVSVLYPEVSKFTNTLYWPRAVVSSGVVMPIDGLVLKTFPTTPQLPPSWKDCAVARWRQVVPTRSRPAGHVVKTLVVVIVLVLVTVEVTNTVVVAGVVTIAVRTLVNVGDKMVVTTAGTIDVDVEMAVLVMV